MPTRYQAVQKGGPLEKTEYEKPSSPGANEVLIRTKAVALNPIDWKMRDFGLYIQSFPAVLGCDAAGVVEAVGSDVKGFKEGDAVLVHCQPGNPKGAAFQDYQVLPSNEVGLKPASWSYEEVASLPVAVMTAAAAIHDAVGTPIPFLGLDKANNKPSAVLVLGGASSVGSSTVELLRLALPDSTIIATSSAKHHDHVQSLGATKVLDYHSSDLVQQIVQAVPSGAQLGAIIDCVNSLALQPELLDVLKKSGGGQKIIAEVVTGKNLSAEQIPEGVSHKPVYSASIQQSQPGFFPLLGQFLNSDEGKRFKVPIPVEVVGNTWESVGEGLERLKAGKVSGTKLAVKLQ